MRGKVEVVEQGEFDAWLAGRPTHAQLAARAPGDPVAGEAHYVVCAACHGPAGEGNEALGAPRLAGIAPWYVRRQLEYFRQGLRGEHAEDVYGQQMRPMAAALADDAAVDAVAAYIATLPDTATAGATLAGDIDRGRRHYRTCSYCHGAEAQGIQALNAPRLAGLQDWYLARQLDNFKKGLRGRHPHDLYGWQMREMARTLNSDAAVRDVVAYIGSLPATPAEPTRVAARAAQPEIDR
jgi:cytochrome c oxidase subunit 2